MPAVTRRGGRRRGCLALLGFMIGFPVTIVALIGLYVGVEQRLAVDDPVTCGDDPMPRAGYVCLNGGDTYDNIVKERHEDYERSPYMIAISAGVVLVAVPLAVWSLRVLRSTDF
ncbi:hypothetical protein ABN028_00340 [Actinopolymorpha sp. B17G11]|uniref:hypothetical protein n=1 Tax=unclassified Actinopolymorpha TaxID=2627063 RepID=UPI0032D910FA